MSLFKRLNAQIPGMGHRGLNRDPYAVQLYEYPRRPDQAHEILDAVAAWLDEIGYPEVTVEFHWHLKKSP